MAPYKEPLLWCSFCGKNKSEVRHLIAGPSVFICNECVDAAKEIILELEIQRATSLKQEPT